VAKGQQNNKRLLCLPESSSQNQTTAHGCCFKSQKLKKLRLSFVVWPTCARNSQTATVAFSSQRPTIHNKQLLEIPIAFQTRWQVTKKQGTSFCVRCVATKRKRNSSFELKRLSSNFRKQRFYFLSFSRRFFRWAMAFFEMNANAHWSRAPALSRCDTFLAVAA